MRCMICGQLTEKDYFSRTWKDPHYTTQHGEYAAWLGGWIKNFIIIGTVDALILGTVLYLLYNYWTPDFLPLITALILYLVPLWILILRYQQKTGFFRRQWKEQHPTYSQQPS